MCEPISFQRLRDAVAAVMAAVSAWGAAAVAEDAAPPLIAQPGLGFALPEGFEARLFHTGVETPRHIAVSSAGVVYLIRRERVGGTGMLALQDADGDGRADHVETFGRFAGSGIAVRTDADGQEWLYASNTTEVWRWPLAPGEVAPASRPQRIARGFPRQAEHPYKPMAFDGRGGMYVMVGAPSNACMQKRRTRGSPGLDPCPQLERHAGVWKFDADAPNQLQSQGEHYATGLRNMIAFTWSRAHDGLYGVQHGRDFLHRYFPDVFSPEEGADLPSEEFHRIDQGDHLGWPYSYYDPIARERRLNPEYEPEDAPTRGRTRTDDYKEPLIGFPAHWAPGDIVFYEAEDGAALFPKRYRGGAFLVFKGGWGRNPNPPQQGFQVVYVPMADGRPAGPHEVFAAGFEGPQPPVSLKDAIYSPLSAAIGPEGAMFLNDVRQGAIWRIAYTGAAAPRDVAEAAPPILDPVRETRQARLAVAAQAHPEGAGVYGRECATCHQANGLGADGFAPALEGSPVLAAEPQALITYVLLGAESGAYANIMPAYRDIDLSDEDLAAALTYARAAFAAHDQETAALSAPTVAAARAALAEEGAP